MTSSNGKKYTARKMVLNDWRNYKNIRLEALLNEPQAFGSSYDKSITKSDEEWREWIERTLTRDAKDVLVGICDIEEEFVGIGGAYEEIAGEWNIIAIYIKPEHRGLGLGKILIENIVSILKKRQEITRLLLKVNINQAAAVNLYKSFGFVVVDVVKDEPMGDGNLYEEYLMMMEL